MLQIEIQIQEREKKLKAGESPKPRCTSLQHVWAHPSSCMAQERMAVGDLRTLPAAAWHCIHARFEAHAVQFF